MSTDNTLLTLFNSFDEAMEYSHAPYSPKEYFNKVEYRATSEGGNRFHGKESDVYDAYKRHDFEKYDAMNSGEFASELSDAEFMSEQWSFCRRLEEGDEIDVSRYVAGHDRCWSGVRKRRKNLPTIRVYVGFGGNCGRSATELAFIGEAATTLVEALEAAGRNVELWAVAYHTGAYANGKNALHMIRLKSESEFCDMGLIGWVTGYDKVFRNTIFRIQARAGDEAGIDCSSSMGRSSAVTKSVLQLTPEEAEAAIIMPQLYDKDSAVSWLKNTLTRIKSAA